MESLNKLVVKNGYHLNTGVLSTPDLCRVLAENGYSDTAYRLLLQEDCPDWLHEVKHGATTVWKTWNGIRPDDTVHDSPNHYSYGTISGWLMGGICGIQLKAGKLTIQPYSHPSPGWAKAKWRSPVGVIRGAWQYEGEIIVFDAEVPVSAELILPGGTYQTEMESV